MTRTRVRKRRDGPDDGRDGRILDSPGWKAALEQFAQATGIAVTLFDRRKRIHAGPFTTTPLAQQLASARCWDSPSGHCFGIDADAAVAAMEENALVRRRGFGLLPVVAVPTRLSGRPIGALVAGWVFDTFADPVATDRLAKTLGLPFTQLWQIVRQQPPVSSDKLQTYAELLQTLADSFMRERAEALQEQEQARELHLLNQAGERIGGARTVDDIGAVVAEAAAALTRASRAALMVPAADGTWRAVGTHAPGRRAHRTLPFGERRQLVTSMRVPVEAADGTLLGQIELEARETDGGLSSARLSGLAAHAAVALQKARLIEDLQRERKSLERANRIKDEFLAVLSHELRTPLTPILGWSTMLRRQLSESVDERTARALAAIERNARQELHLVEEMLDLSRILNDKVHLEPQPVSPAEALANAATHARQIADPSRHRVQVEAAQGLPPVWADPKRLDQILQNLVSNAVKFTPQGGLVTLAVRGGAGDTVEFVVTDTGIGIDPAFIPYVFDRFRQADSTSTRRHGGLGIGLSIVRGLTELHGGKVWAESEGQGSGATFIVSLPAAEPAVIHQRRVAAGGGGAAARRPNAGAGRTVLLVDDAPDTLMVLQTMIEGDGYTVLAAESADAALAIAREQSPDCIVTDIGMPDADGFDLLKQVRADARLRSIPVIALTGYATQLDRQQVLDAGFAAHLPKPIEEATLLRMLDSFLAPR